MNHFVENRLEIYPERFGGFVAIPFTECYFCGDSKHPGRGKIYA
jgi:hypothetical protein